MKMIPSVNKQAIKILVFLSLISLISCTSGRESSHPNEENFQKIIDISKLQEGDLIVLPDILNFGQIESGELTQKVSIKNGGQASQPLSIAVDGHSSIGIKLNRCGVSLDKGKTCEITISFKQRGLYNGIYNSSLLINGASLPITAEVINKPDPDNSGSPQLEITMEGSFETYAQDKIPYRTINIKNIGTGTAHNMTTQLPNDYDIRINRCSTSLKVGHTCSIQVLLKQARQKESAPMGQIVSLVNGIPNGQQDLSTKMKPLTMRMIPRTEKYCNHIWQEPIQPWFTEEQCLMNYPNAQIVTKHIIRLNIDPWADDLRIDWGDGVIVPVDRFAGHPTKLFPDSSERIIKVYGKIYTMGSIAGSNVNRSSVIKELISWGNYEHKNLNSMFSWEKDLTISATDSPNLGSIQSINFMFRDATLKNSNLIINLSNIEDVSYMFQNAEFINSSVSFGNTSKLRRIKGWFSNSMTFNQDLTSYNFGCVWDSFEYDGNAVAWESSKKPIFTGNCSYPYTWIEIFDNIPTISPGDGSQNAYSSRYCRLNGTNVPETNCQYVEQPSWENLRQINSPAGNLTNALKQLPNGEWVFVSGTFAEGESWQYPSPGNNTITISCQDPNSRYLWNKCVKPIEVKLAGGNVAIEIADYAAQGGQISYRVEEEYQGNVVSSNEFIHNQQASAQFFINTDEETPEDTVLRIYISNQLSRGGSTNVFNYIKFCSYSTPNSTDPSKKGIKELILFGHERMQHQIGPFMFAGCSSLTAIPNNLDVANLSPQNMFNGALIFNQDLSHWCTNSYIDPDINQVFVNTPMWEESKKPIFGPSSPACGN